LRPVDNQSPIFLSKSWVSVALNVERIKAQFAVGLSPNDPELESDDFKQAVEIVESARKAARKKP
jgi:hypothetical protein